MVSILIAGSTRRMGALEAYAIVVLCPEAWDCEGTEHRIHTIYPAALRTRHMPSRPVAPWEPTAWHTGPVIQVSPEWLHRMGYAVAV